MRHFMKDRPSLENLKSELLNLLKSEIPNQKELISFVEKIKVENWKSRAYVYFINPQNPNQPNSDWQFEENLILESKKYGTLILDILTDNRIGGVEFYNNLK